jgi:predicted DNA binding CopG/RHH family protein
MNIKKKNVTVHVSKDEKSAIQRRAGFYGIPVSQYLINLIKDDMESKRLKVSYV